MLGEQLGRSRVNTPRKPPDHFTGGGIRTAVVAVCVDDPALAAGARIPADFWPATRGTQPFV
jgi:hypothetical protein